MEVILSGKDKDLKKFLKKERLWLTRNKIEVLADDEESKPEVIEPKVEIIKDEIIPEVIEPKIEKEPVKKGFIDKLKGK